MLDSQAWATLHLGSVQRNGHEARRSTINPPAVSQTVMLHWPPCCSPEPQTQMGTTRMPSWILEKAMATHSSTFAWASGPSGLQSMESLQVGHDWATSLSLSCIGEGNGNPLQCSCLENPRDGGAWWAAIYGVAQSQTWLKRLSSNSSSFMNPTLLPSADSY